MVIHDEVKALKYTVGAATALGTTGLAPFSRSRLISILLILDLAYVINAMDRQVFPILIKPIAGELSLAPAQFGLLSTVFTLGLGLAALPAGYIADRIGRKNMIQAGLIIFSIATGLQGLAHGFSDLTAYRVLSGIGEGAQNAALYTAVGVYFHRNRSLAVGTLNVGFGVGAFIGPLLGNYALQLSGSWRVPLFIFAILGLVVLLVVQFGVPKSLTDIARNVGEIENAPQSEVRLFNRNVVGCMIVATVSGFAIYGYLGLYPTFLQDAGHFTSAQASLISGMFGVGALASIPIGLAADRWNQKALNIIGLLGLMVVGGLMFAVPLPMEAHMVLTVVMGVCFTGILYLNTNTLMQRSVPEHRVGTAVGLFVAALYIPASIAGYVFGSLRVELGWAGAGLIITAVIPTLGLIAMLFVTNPQKAPSLNPTTP